jgi:hypothetical protein
MAAIMLSSCDPDLLRRVERATASETMTAGKRLATTAMRQAAGA